MLQVIFILVAGFFLVRAAIALVLTLGIATGEAVASTISTKPKVIRIDTPAEARALSDRVLASR